MTLLLCVLAFAEDPPPPPEGSGEVEVLPSEQVDVYAVPEVAKARDAVVQQLRADGYHRSERKDGYTIYHNDIPYHPRVILHDDGWVEVRREAVRFHSPGHQFADQGSKLEYLWCVIALPMCISPGGQVISKTKLDALKEDVYNDTHDEMLQLNNAVAGHAMRQRLDHDLPAQMEAIWNDPQQPLPLKKAMLLTLWDSRTDTPEGEQAREAIENFLVAVVQTSSTPITKEELTVFNLHRTAPRALELPTSP